MEFFKAAILFSLLAWHNFATANVLSYFDKIKTDPNALYAFLKEMPKGGELHYHLAGGAYPETMLALAAQNDYCLDRETLSISKTIERCSGIPAAELTTNASLYEQTLRAWSMKDFIPGKESGEEHFFASFYKFLPIVSDYGPQLLAEVMTRAADQQEQYLEIMILPDNAASTSFANHPIEAKDFSAFATQLEGDKAFQKNIHDSAQEATAILKQARSLLGCDKNANLAACQLTIKFQYYVLREQALEKVFAQALNGFAAAANSKDIVAINLVQAEDGLISLRDYAKQMQVFSFLHQRYPKVHISLHAGELSSGLVRPDNLNFHIKEALDVGHAERIGHGVSIAFEREPEKLLQQMAKEHKAVEVNLISNKKILNISGKRHPLRYYLSHHVPVVFSTDDEGLLRTELTNQYVEAVLHHALDYPTLKKINRNALTYSFLNGESLWLDAENAKTVKACEDLSNATCFAFINNNEKAKLQWQLEKKII